MFQNKWLIACGCIAPLLLGLLWINKRTSQNRLDQIFATLEKEILETKKCSAFSDCEEIELVKGCWSVANKESIERYRILEGFRNKIVIPENHGDMIVYPPMDCGNKPIKVGCANQKCVPQ